MTDPYSNLPPGTLPSDVSDPPETREEIEERTFWAQWWREWDHITSKDL